MELKDIKAIIDLMKKNSISEFELERQDFKIKLKRAGSGVGVVGISQVEEASLVAYAPSPAAMALPAAAVPPPASAASGELEIKSPMIGTFYRAPSPESGNYAEVGTEVNPDTVVCLIEAMKVMNEIKAEIRGVIAEVVAENGKPVQYGQVLFTVK